MGNSKKILVVEDVQINRQILCNILGEEYETVQAENGQVALDKLGEYGDEIILILLDIIMPVMDGYTFLTAVKENSDYASIPVIVTTSNDSEEDEVKALSLGATDFIRKPYRPQIVKHRVDGIINLRETAAMVSLMKYDQLTGLYAKEYFYKLATDVIRQNPDTEYDIICSDIEDFSLINDMFGHSVGNELLCIAADILSETVGDGGLCCRINADTFAMLFERGEEYTDQMFENMIARINRQFGRCRLHMDFGIYRYDENDCTVNVACDRAFSAIESIKGKYIQYFAFYDDTIRLQKLHDQALTEGMERALAEKQFLVYYQPKYSLKTGAIVGAEALVRWNSPKEGFLSPGEFIPMFERNGFITQLDQYIWEEVCIFIRACMDMGVNVVPISTNVSRTDLYNPDIPDIIFDIVKKYDLDTKQLHLEITESAYTDQTEVIIDAVRRLSEMGFVIEMDDFGTGYSSLNMLSELPIDVLKLDMKFVQSNTLGTAEKNIINFVIDLAKWMNLIVTAEGAETREQVDRLRAMDCDQVQGYYFSKPVPEADFLEMLKKIES